MGHKAHYLLSMIQDVMSNIFAEFIPCTFPFVSMSGVALINLFSRPAFAECSSSLFEVCMRAIYPQLYPTAHGPKAVWFIVLFQLRLTRNYLRSQLSSVYLCCERVKSAWQRTVDVYGEWGFYVQMIPNVIDSFMPRTYCANMHGFIFWILWSSPTDRMIMSIVMLWWKFESPRMTPYQIRAFINRS